MELEYYNIETKQKTWLKTKFNSILTGSIQLSDRLETYD